MASEFRRSIQIFKDDYNDLTNFHKNRLANEADILELIQKLETDEKFLYKEDIDSINKLLSKIDDYFKNNELNENSPDDMLNFENAFFLLKRALRRLPARPSRPTQFVPLSGGRRRRHTRHAKRKVRKNRRCHTRRH